LFRNELEQLDLVSIVVQDEESEDWYTAALISHYMEGEESGFYTLLSWESEESLEDAWLGLKVAVEDEIHKRLDGKKIALKVKIAGILRIFTFHTSNPVSLFCIFWNRAYNLGLDTLGTGNGQ
jgi:hypothetical protein